ncbi:hypothetical protein [Paradesulfitobacterium ferrireducens]|uniref:hypothetical protein n=1 Tax=Paradesulfitobacterium ferrireducens TaxID=2816476 RepID=UPI001A8C62B3|nr:hypothetical protein [Paradesulfitobacterium ferrireducens]
MYFTDDHHAEIFLRLVANNCKERHTDYWAAYYLLTCKHDIRVKTLEHIGRFIDWLGILNEDFSEEYQQFVQSAFIIFSNPADELPELVGSIDNEYREVMTQAVNIRKNGMRPVPVK